MKRTYILAALAAALILAWALLAGGRGCRQEQVQQGEHQAAVAQGESNVHVQQAQQLQAQADSEREARKTAEANVARLKKENAALLRRLAASGGAGVPPAAGAGAAGQDDPGADPRDAVIEKQQEIIAEQDKVIESQARELKLVRLEASESKAAVEAERRRAAGLQIALDAQKHVQSNERWSGRFEGAGAGALAALLAKAIL